jgi:hypothetical protein
MALDILRERGVPLERQVFTWRELGGKTYSKLDDDAFTRVRVILMNALEAEAVRFGHTAGRYDQQLRQPLARVRRVEHHQQTLVNGLHPADLSTLEHALALEQAEVEITAAAARREPDQALAAVHRCALLEDLDHLYRFAALYDRVEGKDANVILQSQTDIRPGRPTAAAHRDPGADLAPPYRRATATPASKLHALIVTALQQQARDQHVAAAATYADPVGRRLFAEIASVEEQHATRCGGLVDPEETWLERWLLHEAAEVYAYWSCARQESNLRWKGVWERLLDYELGHLHLVIDLMRQIENRDAAELLPATLNDPFPITSQRDFVRQALAAPATNGASGPPTDPAGAAASDRYRAEREAEGSPSETVADGYRYHPGTELAALPRIEAWGRRTEQ